MVKTERASSLLEEARGSYSDALRLLDEAIAELDRDQLVKAAEKTWAATLQSTNALLVVATGSELDPVLNDGAGEVFQALAAMSRQNAAWDELMDKFGNLHHILHDTVLCDRDIEPVSVLIQDIREAGDYIRECERMAGVEGG